MEPESDDDDDKDSDNHNIQGEQVMAQPTVNTSEVLASAEVLTILSLKADVPEEVFTQLSGIDKYLVTTATNTFEKTEVL